MKAIVLYFSRTGQNYSNGSIVDLPCGNTAIAAGYIHEIMGADLFEVKSVAEYPADYMKCTEVAKDELNSNARPAVSEMPGNLSQYDTIFVGGPIWWGTYPMPMFSVLEQIDWAGKTVLPFSTHEGSGLGNIMSDMRRVCAGANVKPGLAIHGSNVAAARSDIEKWIEKEAK
ncbi:MAG: flavodoxin [Alphaproteobacteria bacterium]|nr:flavodoxin [Alphaproteobacteria bacterium]